MSRNTTYWHYDGARYRYLSSKRTRHVGADLPPEIEATKRKCSLALVRIYCPKKSCDTLVAEVTGNLHDGPLLATAFDRGPEQLVRTGTARLNGQLGADEKAPDRDLALFWPIGDLPVRWHLRCPKCSLRSEIASASLLGAADTARTQKDTVTVGASRIH